ncbi:MAG: hypothetical protein FJ390_04685 [Verrucomicrobia bacterium]|nr:hypothetical protein [Verrucomicrobiota bacterium]
MELAPLHPGADEFSGSRSSGATTSPADSPASFGDHDIEIAEASEVPHPTTNSCAGAIPSHYDPLHPVVLANNTFSDTLIYATLVSDVFNMPVENCIAAGIAGNLAFALATSPYVSSKVMALLPNEESRDVARNFDKVVRTLIDPGYFAYYTTAWPALGVATIPEACAFIFASALMRKGASLLLQSEMCKGSLEQQAKALVSTDEVLQPSLRALLRVMRDFTPDLVAALSRSGVSNLYAHEQGKFSAKEALDKTLFSGAVYIIATFLYYACYRALEQLGTRSTGMYQKPADLDRVKAEELKTELGTFYPDFNTSSEDSHLRFEEQQALVSGSPSRLLSPIERARVQSLSKSFEVLKSPLVNLYKDPIYRSLIELTYHYRKDPDSKNAIEAFHAIDAADLLNKVVGSLEGDKTSEDQINAYKILLQHLGIEVPSTAMTPGEIQAIQEKGIEALIQMFQSHAASRSHQPFSLLGAAQGNRGSYGAISDDDGAREEKV